MLAIGERSSRQGIYIFICIILSTFSRLENFKNKNLGKIQLADIVSSINSFSWTWIGIPPLSVHPFPHISAWCSTSCLGHNGPLGPRLPMSLQRGLATHCHLWALLPQQGPLVKAVWFLTEPERMSGELWGLSGLRCAEPFSLRELIPETKNWCNTVDFWSTAEVGSSSF